MSQYINKVIYDGNTLIDLTSDTVDAAHLLYGYTAHLKSGSTVTGQCTYNADTSDATAGAAEILATKTAYVNGNKITGSMTNNGAVTGTISASTAQYTIPSGFHDGSGKVSIASSEQEKLIASNIKSGVTILGVEGSYSGQAISVQSNKNVTPSSTQQIILPSNGYDYLAQVTVAAIPCSTATNAAGGVTYTIG